MNLRVADSNLAMIRFGPRCWRGPITTMLLVLSVGLCGGVPIAVASSSDAQSTRAYLVAQYRLVTRLSHETAKTRGVERASAAQIDRECPGVVSGMPQESFTESFSSRSPRVKGEGARLAKQKETIDSELFGAVLRPGDNSSRAAEEAYDAEVQGLSWNNPAIAATLQATTTARLEAISAPIPLFCADARAWAQSGYRDLSAASREYEALQAARRSTDHRRALPWKRC